MAEARVELVRSWFIKASHDLASAKTLSHEGEELLDVAIYHCQQAAEKAIKGFLVYHQREFEKTHDLEKTLRQAMEFEPRLWSLLDDAHRLTPFAWMYRYPEEVLNPDLAEFARALTSAENIFKTIVSFLPPDLLL